MSDDGSIRLCPEAVYEKGNLIELWLAIVSGFLFINSTTVGLYLSCKPNIYVS